MKHQLIIAIYVVLFSTTYAQINIVGNAVTGGVNDAKKLTKAYLLPVEHSMAFANSNGYVNFTNTDKKLSFYFGTKIAVISTLSKDLTYNVNDLNLQEVEAVDPNNTIAQTFFGVKSSILMQTKSTYKKPSSSYPFYTKKPVATFSTPQGVSKILVMPALNFGIKAFGTHFEINGLIKMPIPETNANIFSFGFSAQHDLSYFFDFMKDFPVRFDILLAYQKTKLSYYLDIKPNETRTELSLNSKNGPYDNQVFTIETYGMPIELILSKKIKHFHLFGFVGYSFQSSKISLNGNYPIYASDPNDLFKVIVIDIVDPFAYENSFNEFHAGLGAIYQLSSVKIKTSASFARYFLYNVGFEIKF